jgi:hypothetical protein
MPDGVELGQQMLPPSILPLCKGSGPLRVARFVLRHERGEEVPPVGSVALLARREVRRNPE